MPVLCGHIDQKHFAGNKCKQCYQSQPHIKAQAVINAKAYRLRRGEGGRRREHLKTLERKFGLAPEAYEQRVLEQNGVCAICKQRNNVKRSPHLRVDHCHATNKLRALLCHKCNVGLGTFGDDVNLMQIAIDYLKFWKEQHANA